MKATAWVLTYLQNTEESLVCSQILLLKSETSPMEKLARPIVIFDSGVGGLSIYQEIKQMLPQIEVIYCADTLAFPYGPKPEEEVIERTSRCLAELARQYNPALVVIACNTASTISLPRARAELDIPVVGVVPAIKTASEASDSRCIGLLATPGTVERDYTDQLINDFAEDCHVIRVGSSELVHLAEQYLRGETAEASHLEDRLKEIVAPFFANGHSPDAIVLGCTHFPLLRKELKKISPGSVRWIDSGSAIARRVKHLIEFTPEGSGKRDTFVHTGSAEQIEMLVPALDKMGFNAPLELQ